MFVQKTWTIAVWRDIVGSEVKDVERMDRVRVWPLSWGIWGPLKHFRQQNTTRAISSRINLVWKIEKCVGASGRFVSTLQSC